MAAQKNRWLIGIVLIFSLVALLAVSLLPILGSTGNRRTEAPGSTPNADASSAQAELESRAKGYELVLQREPDNQTALKGLVESRIQLGDLQGLVDPLTRLAELNPTVPDYRVLLGQTKQQLGDLEGAAQSYRQVLDNQPGNMNALQGLVALLVQQNRSQAAVGLLQDTLKSAERLSTTGGSAVDVTSVKLLLAEVYLEDQKVDQALKLYDEAIQEAGQDFRPLLAKALVLQDQGRPEEAQPLFDQALSMAPAQYKDQIQQLAAAGTTDSETPASTPDAAAEPVAPETDGETPQGE
ncbi:tetratricopeptide repeat protein [Pseudanabaena sp. FACHB-2040]|uniref:tetratricopeptide repeat protein n=1 Tax=Pseudanabaena sp. FACHB-2040 TaxID=2692859 RepID=UPI0016873674|nr:tetratricopeptide repeat protein [Pseudanabaena sp. FACHB-2040]MBD2258855.1 tetratricopeptide repeat protein [Pseudanabaena sp. FACHB-2040]